MSWAVDPIDPGWWARSGYPDCARTAQFLMAYLDAELPEGDRAGFEKHLKGCDHCAQFMETYRRATEAGKKALLEPERIPQELQERLAAFLKSKLSTRRG